MVGRASIPKWAQRKRERFGQWEKKGERKRVVFFFLVNGVCNTAIVRERVNREREREKGLGWFELFIKYLRFLWLVHGAE